MLSELTEQELRFGAEQLLHEGLPLHRLECSLQRHDVHQVHAVVTCQLQ